MKISPGYSQRKTAPSLPGNPAFIEPGSAADAALRSRVRAIEEYHLDQSISRLERRVLEIKPTQDRF